MNQANKPGFLSRKLNSNKRFSSFQQINSAFSVFSLGAHPDAQCTYVFADITAHQVAGGSLWVPIITQSGPKVQALIIVSSRDSKIKDLAPIALLCASTDPRCSGLLTVDFRETERVCVSQCVCERATRSAVCSGQEHHSSLSNVHVAFAKASLNDDVCAALPDHAHTLHTLLAQRGTLSRTHTHAHRHTINDSDLSGDHEKLFEETIKSASFFVLSFCFVFFSPSRQKQSH